MKDFDWLILYELYKNPNMTKAANLLYITQPSLTKRLQHIESEFQSTIVNRTPKGLEFTQEGEYLAKRAELYLQFMKETKEQISAFHDKQEGLITVGAAYTYSKYALSEILYQYNKTYPHIQFHVINEPSNILFRKMLDDSIDVGFIRGDYEGAVNKILVGIDQAYLVTKSKTELDDLSKLMRIEYKSNDRTIELLEYWWEERFHSPMPSGMLAGFVDMAWQMIHRGMGYTCCFLPENFINEYDLCLTPLTMKDGTKLSRNTWFIYSKNKRRTKILEDFIHYIKKEVALK